MGKTDWFQGTADAIAKNMDFVKDTRSDLVLVLSADHVYCMNYQPLMDFHQRHNADLTIVTTRRPDRVDPRHFGYATAGPKGRLTLFDEKQTEIINRFFKSGRITKQQMAVILPTLVRWVCQKCPDLKTTLTTQYGPGLTDIFEGLGSELLTENEKARNLFEDMLSRTREDH